MQELTGSTDRETLWERWPKKLKRLKPAALHVASLSFFVGNGSSLALSNKFAISWSVQNWQPSSPAWVWSKRFSPNKASSEERLTMFLQHMQSFIDAAPLQSKQQRRASKSPMIALICRKVIKGGWSRHCSAKPLSNCLWIVRTNSFIRRLQPPETCSTAAWLKAMQTWTIGYCTV